MSRPRSQSSVRTPEEPSRWWRLRTRYRWLDHLARAVDRYVEYNGYHYVASITYFSLLSLVPILMVALSLAGSVLAGQPQLLGELRQAIAGALPGPASDTISTLLDRFLEQRGKVGVFGLLVGLYSGWNWINAVRDGLTAMWDQQRPQLPLVRTVLKDLLALLSLVVALVISFALSAIGGALGNYLLHVARLDHTMWAHTALALSSVPLALLSDWLVFLWVLAKLPREPVGTRSALRGALAAAIGFELLKQAGNVYLRVIGNSATGATFGSVIGLLFFISLVSRLLVFITAWTATARDAPRQSTVPTTATVVRPVVLQRSAPALPAAAGLLTGVLGTMAFQRLRRDRVRATRGS